MPGAPHNRSAKPPERSKIEYLDDIRKARSQQTAQQDALQYDSKFRKAAAEHGDKFARQRFLKESTPQARPRPQGVGGRQRFPQTSRQAPVPIRGKQAGTATTPQAGTRPPAQSAGQVRGSHKPAGQHAAPGQAGAQASKKKGQARGSGGQAAGKARPKKGQVGIAAGQDRPKKKQTARGERPQKGQARPKTGQAPGQKKPQPAAEHVQPAKARGDVSGTRNGAKGAGRAAGVRPQRDTVTDFHSVAPRPAASGAAARKATPKSNGHGRKLKPTYDAKADKKRPKRQGTPIMEGGAVGFDIGTYEREPAGSGPAYRPLKPSSVVTTVLTIVICFVLLTAVLAGQARLSNYSQQNATLEKSIVEMEERISKLKMQIALEEDLGNIQERATALGLQSPDDSQIEYVDLEATDEEKEVPGFVVSEQSSASAAPGLFGALMAWFDTMLHGSQTALVSTAEPAAEGS